MTSPLDEPSTVRPELRDNPHFLRLQERVAELETAANVARMDLSWHKSIGGLFAAAAIGSGLYCWSMFKEPLDRTRELAEEATGIVEDAREKARGFLEPLRNADGVAANGTLLLGDFQICWGSKTFHTTTFDKVVEKTLLRFDMPFGAAFRSVPTVLVSQQPNHTDPETKKASQSAATAYAPYDIESSETRVTGSMVLVHGETGDRAIDVSYIAIGLPGSLAER